MASQLFIQITGYYLIVCIEGTGVSILKAEEMLKTVPASTQYGFEQNFYEDHNI